MIQRNLADWARDQFLQLVVENGDAVWSEGEELRKRKKLSDLSIQEGRLVGRFSADKPYRAELLFPVFSTESWDEFIATQRKSARITAHLLANLLPWRDEAFREFLNPAGIIPKDEQGAGPGQFSSYTAALLQEFCSRAEEDPFIVFQLRGRGREEVIDSLRQIRAELLEINLTTEEKDEVEEELPNAAWDNVSNELFQIPYSLRADELPALLFKRIESIPLPGKTEIVEHVMSELYVHIAKRAQAYGLSFRR